ncbi:AMP-binding protein [Pelagerythrobacter sp.]|uniref:AMP-binding protein n=1 Tax=Pelagerythrobacter sp. TaxID=2800702 RepID=UPI0035AFDB27
MLRPLSLGGRSVVLPRWDSEIAIDLIEQERATIAPGTTVFLRGLVERYERSNSPGHHLEIFSSSGAPNPPNLARRADAQGIYAFRSYGMTECLRTIAHPRFGTALRLTPRALRKIDEGWGGKSRIVCRKDVRRCSPETRSTRF